MSTSDTCGYSAEIRLTDEEISTETCDRPVWKDHDRCVWHAPVDGKTMEVLENAGQGSIDEVIGAYLQGASLVDVEVFAETSLIDADFSGADLRGADFAGADLREVDFTDADLTNSNFTDADLTFASLRDARAISADFTEANLEGAILSNGDFRRASLVDARLHESIITDVHISDETEFGHGTVYERHDVGSKVSNAEPLAAAAWTYRQFQDLYRRNSLPDKAQWSYFRERDALRKLAWSQSAYVRAAKWEVSRWVMRYGGSPYRVLLTSLFVITICALLYPFTGGIQESQEGASITYQLTVEEAEYTPQWLIAQTLFKSFYFSVVTFATLGYGDIQPIGPYARLLAGVEAILGALLAALLVFVLTRVVTW